MEQVYQLTRYFKIKLNDDIKKNCLLWTKSLVRTVSFRYFTTILDSDITTFKCPCHDFNHS